MTTTRPFPAAARRAVLGGIVLASAGLLMAQAPTQAGAIEVSGAFGAAAHLPSLSSALQSDLAALGVTASVSGSNFDWYAGGSFGYAVRPSLLIVGQTNYNHAGSANISTSDGTFSSSLSLTDFTGGVHWQLPVGSQKLVPYLAVEAGGTRVAGSVSGSALPVSVSTSSTARTFEFGGGVRYYIHPSWGIRPEVMVVRIPGTTYVRIGVGVFWQSKAN